MRRKPADDLADDAWHRFLGEAIGGFRAAARRLNETTAGDVAERRPGWFGKGNKAVKGARLPDETAISQALIEEMEEIRAAQIIGSPGLLAGEPDLTGMDFHYEVARLYDPAIGPRAQETDLQFAIHRERLDLRVEAKKLTKPGDIAADYLGAEGLGRFDDADAPYTLERFGGMMAYVTDKDSATWGGLIAAGIRGSLAPERVSDTLLSGEAFVTTTHVRDIDIKLFELKGRFTTHVLHMVLEFEARPSRRRTPAARRTRQRRQILP